MDLIQVGVRETGSRKKRILCVSPKAEPAQPAAPRGHYILYTVFCLTTILWLTSERKVPSQEIDHFATQVSTSLVFRPLIQNSPHFSYISPKMVLESFPNLHPVDFLQSIGLELIISSRTD